MLRAFRARACQQPRIARIADRRAADWSLRLRAFAASDPLNPGFRPRVRDLRERWRHAHTHTHTPIGSFGDQY
eukprot:8522882-Alexandrium_andersonii.AAC.1